MNRRAILIGATGLIGSELLNLLLADSSYSQVKVLHRRSTGISHPKLDEHVVNFDDPDSWNHLLEGDDLYSALGTTIKKAGSQQEQYKVDFTYQFEAAKDAAENGVKKYALVSSAGASSKSRLFYSKLKGELDEAVKSFPFESILIFRPSILAGERKEKRPAEKFGMILAKVFTKVPGLHKYRPIPARTVAHAMINSVKSDLKGYNIFEMDEVFEQSKF